MASDGRMGSIGSPDLRIAAFGNCRVKHGLKGRPDRIGHRNDFGRNRATLVELGVSRIFDRTTT